MSRVPGVLALALLVAGCGRAGVLRGTVFPAAASSPVGESEDALERFAPVVIQEVALGLVAHLDQPTALDPDGSGTLADDAASMTKAPDDPVPLYAATVGAGPRLYLFYGLYYPADWSGNPQGPKLDHAGDFEGTLVVVDGATRRVEAVVTQAHRFFYVWLAGDIDPLPAFVSGTVALLDGHPVLFSESGGHGLYAHGHGRWRPRGGRQYPGGPAALPRTRLRPLVTQVRPLEELQRFTHGIAGGFRDLPPGALPPWLWADRRGGALGQVGAIVRDPGGLYTALRRSRCP